MLSEASITEARAAGGVEIEPFADSQLRAASYVLRLGNRFRRWKPGIEPIEIWSPNAAGQALEPPFDADNLVLAPGEFILAATLEKLRISDSLVGAISPLSHVARFGLGATIGADFINPGFGAAAPVFLTLELVNHNRRPLSLRSRMPIVHLRLVNLANASANRRRKSIYDGADPVVGPMLYEEWSSLLGEKL